MTKFNNYLYNYFCDVRHVSFFQETQRQTMQPTYSSLLWGNFHIFSVHKSECSKFYNKIIFLWYAACTFLLLIVLKIFDSAFHPTILYLKIQQIRKLDSIFFFLQISKIVSRVLEVNLGRYPLRQSLRS